MGTRAKTVLRSMAAIALTAGFALSTGLAPKGHAASTSTIYFTSGGDVNIEDLYRIPSSLTLRRHIRNTP